MTLVASIFACHIPCYPVHSSSYHASTWHQPSSQLVPVPPVYPTCMDRLYTISSRPNRMFAASAFPDSQQRQYIYKKGASSKGTAKTEQYLVNPRESPWLSED
ncbi:hypothetical protein SCLCIDRAFT_1221219 [Scleroderma citrinum Foug A]|uniref:Uncharacterized protein n=1 Tax=Scleroderma citrinum Foug A TaxID=1036808 RepID=A0A0C3DH10_9AGAM|nr:hypothetical protein SCLCIDRAFT_1221219 [Scleroderma citrinum Foug A]